MIATIRTENKTLLEIFYELKQYGFTENSVVRTSPGEFEGCVDFVEIGIKENGRITIKF